jgi:hypothetical protein
MLWVGWRQQRSETLITAAFLVVLMALLLPTGLQMASAYDDGGLTHCVAHGDTDACRAAIDAFAARFAKLGDLLAWLTVIPGVIGVLLAAPLVQQFEHRTYRLDWTQSVTRGRWLAGKLGLAVATAIVTAVALTLLITWWRTPWVHLQGRMGNSVYDSEGTVVVGYTLFALGLGTAVGAVWRRAVPSLIVAFAGYFALRVFVDTWVRERLMEPVTRNLSLTGTKPPNLDHDWVLSQYPVDAHGQALNLVTCPGNGTCAVPVEAHFEFMHVVYHPASHFWALQIRETALFGGLAVALLAFGIWWTLKRAT